ncbi:MAG: hypothetical protein IPJ88_12045 [Myxococcales bacterium]|nr:MAG: hypothetical protein IPJ88_12045 [Myxococcales bacterium]
MGLSLQELLKATTFEAKDPSELDSKAMLQTMERYAFLRVRGVVAPEAVIKAKEAFKKRFSAKDDHPSVGEDPSALHDNYQKLSIGGAQGYGVYRPRCLRTIYNPIWAEDIYGMRENFRKLAQVRNVLYGLPLNFAVDKIDDGMWTAARIHHYPAGGGFLISHKDNVVPRMQEEKGYPSFYQLIMVMTKKGVDFQEGGGFAVIDGERYFYESEVEYGDIVVYDGRTEHGVGDIDPSETFDQNSPAGRLVAFATLYKTMSKGEKVWQGGLLNPRE